MISEILPRVKNEYPNAKPVNLTKINQTVDYVNKVLRFVPRVDNKLHCMEHNEFYNEDGTFKHELLSRDGLHLSFAGTQILTDKIMKKAESLQSDSNTEQVVQKDSSSEVLYASVVKHDTVSKRKSVSRDTLPTSEKLKVKCDTNLIKKSPQVTKSKKSKNSASTQATFQRTTPIASKSKGNLIHEDIEFVHFNRYTVLEHYQCELLSDSDDNNDDSCEQQIPPRKQNLKTNRTCVNDESSEIMTILSWIDSSDDMPIPDCVLANISFDDMHMSLDVLNFKCNNKGFSFRNENKSENFRSDSLLSGGGNAHEDHSVCSGDKVDDPNNINVDCSENHEEGEIVEKNIQSPENESSNVYMNKSEELSPLDIIGILSDIDASKIAEQIDFKPKGGSVYLYALKNGKKNDDDWRCDGYSFVQNGSKKVKIKDNGLSLRKIYFKLMNENKEDNRFKKHVWRLEGDHENSNIVLIHYTGDESIFKGQPHGNSKHNKKVFVRTKPSVINKIKDKEPRNPVAVMNKINSEINAECKETGYSNVRNKTQVKNIQRKMRLENGLGPDSLYNLHLLFYHLEGYISDIKTAPDLYVLLGLKEIYDEFDKLLRFKTDETVPLFYDTTFKLGDFYVSTLSFQHHLFENAPVIPLGIMIHERKFQKHHEVFLETIKEKIPRLGNSKLAIVTDRETGIINAIKKVFPNLTLLVCWNHILRDTKDFLRKCGETSTNIEAINQQLKDLLKCDSLDNYKDMLYGDISNQKENPGVRSFWSVPFVEYFDRNLDKVIRENAGKWVVEGSDVFNPFTGITNNASESNHARYKHLTEFKENQVDLMVLFLQYLQKNDFNAIMKGFCDLGDLNLRKKFRNLKQDPSDVKLAPVLHPSKLIEIIKGKLLFISQENETITDSNKENIERADTEKSLPELDKECNLNNKTNATETLSSQGGHANKVIFDKGITLVPEMGGFMVKGDSGNLYAVQLFPKEKCQCPATVRCYHIKAARQSINLPPDNEKNQKYNLNELRKRSRKKADKKSGRKKPRLGDLDTSKIIPAPDSILNTLNNSSDEDFNLSIHHDFTESTPKQNKTTPHTPKSILKNKIHLTNSESKKSLRFENNFKSKVETSPKALNAENCMDKQSIEAKEELILTSEKNEEVQNVLDEIIEIPPKIPKVSKEEIVGVDLDLELSRSYDQDTPKYECPWIESLLLNQNDKTLLLNYKKLHSGHMEAANIIARKEYPKIKGFQLTERIPKYIKDEGRWHVGTVMQPVSGPACQILHTNADHWVVSFLTEDGNIYLFDSLGTERPDRMVITPSLQIQLAILYGKNRKSIPVIVPDTQRQNNGTDCGMFAIAHMFEFCLKENICPNVIFDTTKMRKHLVSCFETGSIIEFPKTTKVLNLRKKKAPKTFEIDLFCICNLPECLDNVVQCEMCNEWFHKQCVLAPADISMTDMHFICPSCE